MRQRAQRVAQAIQDEMSEMLLNELKDPRLPELVSVTDVEVSDDLRHAKIFISVYGSEEEKDDTMAALQSAAGFVRSSIGDRLRLQHTPEVSFSLDNSLERGAHVEALLRQLKQEDGGSPEGGAASGGSEEPDSQGPGRS